MLHNHNHFFVIALRSLVFAGASLLFAACSGSGGAVTPPVDPSMNSAAMPDQSVSQPPMTSGAQGDPGMPAGSPEPGATGMPAGPAGPATAASPPSSPAPAASAFPATNAPQTMSDATTPGDPETNVAGSAAGSNPARFAGCPVYTAGDYYNADVTHATPDVHSAEYIQAARAAGDTSGFWTSTGTDFVNIANGSTPHLTVHPDVPSQTFPRPLPWSPSFRVESGGDRRAMVLDTSTCHVYELIDAVYASGRLSAYRGADWALGRPLQPAAGPSAMASGLPLFAGMVKWEEVKAGAINHALNWEAPEHTVGNGIYVRPASSAESYTFNGQNYALPYGAHLRLKASFDISNFPPQAKIVAQALKTYGIYLSDTGSYGNGLYFANALNGSNPWNGRDLSALGSINLSDFDVLPISKVHHT